MAGKIGIVGGLGWRATAYYYSAFHEIVERRSFNQPRAQHGGKFEIAIESLDLSFTRSLLSQARVETCWSHFEEYHRAALMRLQGSGVETAVIACNTPHERLEGITRGVDLEVVDIFEAVCSEAARRRAQRLLVLGTSTTMQSRRLGQLLASRGIERVVPKTTDIAELELLIDRLDRGTVEGAWDRLLAIVRRSIGEPRACDFVGLHCTELPLALPAAARASAFVSHGVHFLNASIIHVEEALRAAGQV